MLNTLVVSIAKQLVSESVHAVITILSIPERRFLTLSSTPNAGYEACWDVSNMTAFLSGTIFVVHMNRNCSDSSDDTIATQRSDFGGVCLFWDDCRPTKTPSSAPTPSPTTGTPTKKLRNPSSAPTPKPQTTRPKKPTKRPTKKPTKRPTKRPTKTPS